MRIAVIGAGVVGLACASTLRQRGHEVTVIDPVPPGEGCSFGNAGCFSRCSFVPLGLPGLWKKVPGWLLDPSGPLSIPLAYAPHVARWVWRLHRSTPPQRVNAIADALFPLLDSTLDQWRPLAAWAGVPELVREDGYAWAYESERAFLGDAYGRELRLKRGVRIEVLQGDAIREYEPALAPSITHLVRFPEQGHCPNPLRLSQALAARLKREGVRFVLDSAYAFEWHDRHVTRVVTASEKVEADAFVIAAGAHSHRLAAQLGTRVLLETERGYHLTLARATVMPHVPIMSAEGKFFATPMEMGLRVAGTVELAGLHAQPHYERTAPLLEGARRLFPGLSFETSSRWMGHRPSLPDSMPVIGRAPHAANAYFAFGHGHVGLTAAAPTARVIAALIAGESPYIDIAPFAPDRPAIRA
ncbi:MAG TPA: FAD-dependent oxidoreductase [Usitatibacter sp.]|nr:FAD-dependent oxidoreductase [Usitatibacter sp.]